MPARLPALEATVAFSRPGR